MTALPPDPDPATSTGLEPGGGVSPGSTPPDSGSTAGQGDPGPTPTRKVTPTALIVLAVVVVFIALAGSAVVFLVADLF
ncbi:MAG: DUF6480 family protein [Mycobacterium sp.]